MAALMRTFLILGSPVLGGAITREQRALLRELQDLYLRPDPTPQLAESLNAITPGQATVITSGTSESGRASTHEQNTQPNAQDTLQQGQKNWGPGGPDSAVDVETTGRRSDRDGRVFKRMRHGSDDTQNKWSWGPASSSQDKASWLPRMMGHADVE
ncbi:MAG: hypothetical protein LQ340_004169 [Diploschistes diacapsis]|nr:MAG: hypothetical protein LQ340_004169 [Diploschistes diacapsis]